MKFKIENQSLASATIHPRVKLIMDYLDSLPDGTMLLKAGLYSALNLTKDQFHRHSGEHILDDYKEPGAMDGRHLLLWGSRKTIKAYREWKREQKQS